MTKEKGSDLLCAACEMAVVWMENQLRENATKDRILAYANQLCEKLPSPMGESTVSCNEIGSMPDQGIQLQEVCLCLCLYLCLTRDWRRNGAALNPLLELDASLSSSLTHSLFLSH